MRDAIDRRIILVLQNGLPLVPRPYHAVAEWVGLTPEDILTRLRVLYASGIIRRICAIPNHYALGYRANGMTVWDIPEDRIPVIGKQVGAWSFVSHCYHRPRRPPSWPYTLFTMVHARDRVALDQQIDEMVVMIGPYRHDVLVSTRILKKTGLRLVDREILPSCSASVISSGNSCLIL